MQPGGQLRGGLQLSDVPRSRSDCRRRSPASPRIVGFGANLAYHGQTLNGEGMLVSGIVLPGARVAAGARPAARRRTTTAPSASHSSPCSATTTGRRGSARTRTSLNETIIVNGQAMTIVGVAPQGFDGTTLGSEPKVFVPLTMRDADGPAGQGFDNRQHLLGRICSRGSSRA